MNNTLHLPADPLQTLLQLIMPLFIVVFAVIIISDLFKNSRRTDTTYS
jgi:hypothetical protein